VMFKVKIVIIFSCAYCTVGFKEVAFDFDLFAYLELYI
jgi:hypothetical protein